MPEHLLAIGIIVVENDIGVRAHTQVPLLRHTKRPRRPGRGDDGDLGESVLSIDPWQMDPFHRLVRQLLQAFLPEIGIHQQVNDLRVAPEAGSIRMVRGQVDPPRVVNQKE